MDAVSVLYPGAVASAANPINMDAKAPLQIGPFLRTVTTPLDWSATRFAGHLGSPPGLSGLGADLGTMGMALAFAYGINVLELMAANWLLKFRLSTGQVLSGAAVLSGVGLALSFGVSGLGVLFGTEN